MGDDSRHDTTPPTQDLAATEVGLFERNCEGLLNMQKRDAMSMLRGGSFNQSSACSVLFPSSLVGLLASAVQLHSSQFLRGKVLQRQAPG